MYINGIPTINNWIDEDVEFCIRMGQRDNYYEIRQPIYKGWNEKNHINIDIDKILK